MDFEIKVPIWLFETLSLMMKLEGFLWGLQGGAGGSKARRKTYVRPPTLHSRRALCVYAEYEL